jgi:hypothetical protein
MLAGPRHFREFRDFGRRGGLMNLVREAGANVIRRGDIDGRTLTILTLENKRAGIVT